MAIKFTNEALERIDKAKSDWLKNSGTRAGEGVHIDNDCFGVAGVYLNDHYLFKVSEMWAVVNELNAMVDIIRDTVGIYEDR